MAKDEKNNSKYIKIGWIAVLVVISLWAGSYFIIDCFSDEGGSVGDQFGAVNALFSGLAFAGLIITLLMQREDLNLQRKEMEKTNEELKGQKEQFKLQNETLAKQQFESTFFQLMNQVNNVRGNIMFKDDNNTIEYIGENAFEEVYYSLKEQLNQGHPESFNRYSPREEEDVTLARDKEIYYDFYTDYSFIGLFFRSLYRLIKYVDDSELTDYEKYQYTSFVRSQLSDDILLLLFYNCTLGSGERKFKPLLETYVLLNNMPKETLAYSKHIDYISNDAFERGNRYNKEEKN